MWQSIATDLGSARTVGAVMQHWHKMSASESSEAEPVVTAELSPEAAESLRHLQGGGHHPDGAQGGNGHAGNGGLGNGGYGGLGNGGSGGLSQGGDAGLGQGAGGLGNGGPGGLGQGGNAGLGQGVGGCGTGGAGASSYGSGVDGMDALHRASTHHNQAVEVAAIADGHLSTGNEALPVDGAVSTVDVSTVDNLSTGNGPLPVNGALSTVDQAHGHLSTGDGALPVDGAPSTVDQRCGAAGEAAAADGLAFTR